MFLYQDATGYLLRLTSFFFPPDPLRMSSTPSHKNLRQPFESSCVPLSAAELPSSLRPRSGPFCCSHRRYGNARGQNPRFYRRCDHGQNLLDAQEPWASVELFAGTGVSSVMGEVGDVEENIRGGELQSLLATKGTGLAERERGRLRRVRMM
jgi:hypothetical protein